MRQTKPGCTKYGRTDDKVNLGAKLEFERFMAHEIGHLDLLNDTVLRDSLRMNA